MTVILTPEEGEEYKRVYAEYEKATIYGGEVLRRYGMESREFREADARTTDLWRRLRELQGEAGQPWNA